MITLQFDKPAVDKKIRKIHVFLPGVFIFKYSAGLILEIITVVVKPYIKSQFRKRIETKFFQTGNLFILRQITVCPCASYIYDIPGTHFFPQLRILRRIFAAVSLCIRPANRSLYVFALPAVFYSILFYVAILYFPSNHFIRQNALHPVSVKTCLLHFVPAFARRRIIFTAVLPLYFLNSIKYKKQISGIGIRAPTGDFVEIKLTVSLVSKHYLFTSSRQKLHVFVPRSSKIIRSRLTSD